MMIKQRSIGMCIFLTIITCGIYGLYWLVVVTDDVNQESGETNATSGGMSLLLTIITCNIYGLYWAYKMGERVDIIKTRHGIPSNNSNIMYMVIQFFGFAIVNYALMQDTVNKFADTFPPQINAGGYGQNGYNQNYGQSGYNQNYGQNGYNQNYGQNGYNQNYGQNGYNQGSGQQGNNNNLR